MSLALSNRADVLDSRNIISRIEELEGERESLVEARDEAQAANEAFKPDAGKLKSELQAKFNAARQALEDWNASEDARELAALKALAEEAQGCGDWRYGDTLIRDSYFCDYAEKLAHDCYDMKQAESWPFCHIDWEAAAGALKQDYSSVDFDGVTYWIRS